MDAGVPRGAGGAGADGVTLHPLLAFAQPLAVEQVPANGLQGLHISGRPGRHSCKFVFIFGIFILGNSDSLFWANIDPLQYLTFNLNAFYELNNWK